MQAAPSGPRPLAALALGVLAAACGSTALSDLLPRGGAGDAGVTTTGTDASVTGAGDGGVGGSDGGGRRDGAADVATATPDAGRIACPATSAKTCDLATQICCRKGGPSNPSFACQAPSTSCPDLRIPCSEASHCERAAPGTVCCGDVSSGLVEQLACRPAADCTLGDGRVVVCNPADDDPCPAGGACTESKMTLVGYDLCLN